MKSLFRTSLHLICFLIVIIFTFSCRLLDHNYLIPSSIVQTKNSHERIKIRYNNKALSISDYSKLMYPNNTGEQDLLFLSKMTESYYLLGDEISLAIKKSLIQAIPIDNIAGLEILRFLLLSQKNPIGFEWKENVLTKEFLEKKKFASLLGVYEILMRLYHYDDVMNFLKLYREFSELYDFHIENESPFTSGLLLQIPILRKHLQENRCDLAEEIVLLFERVYHEQDDTRQEYIRLSRNYLFSLSKLDKKEQEQLFIDATLFQNYESPTKKDYKKLHIQWWWDGFADAFALGAQCSIQNEKYDHGLKLLLLSLSLSPHNSSTLLVTGQIYLFIHHYQNAKQLFDMVLQYGNREQKISAYQNLIVLAAEQDYKVDIQKYKNELLLLESKK